MLDTLKKVLKNASFDEGLCKEIINIGRAKNIKAGEVLIDKETKATEIPIILSGVLKVSRHDEDDNMVFLYFLEGGETCAMSISCCLEGKKASFYVTAEEDSCMWMVPMEFMDIWVSKYRSFRKFIFQAYQTRFNELLGTIDTIVFGKLDQRIYQYLLDLKEATASFVIKKTQEEIAIELNTSRVVVSRLLKQLEKEGKISYNRNKIEIL